MSVCLSVCLSVRLSACLSLCLPVRLSARVCFITTAKKRLLPICFCVVFAFAFGPTACVSSVELAAFYLPAASVSSLPLTRLLSRRLSANLCFPFTLNCNMNTLTLFYLTQ